MFGPKSIKRSSEGKRLQKTNYSTTIQIVSSFIKKTILVRYVESAKVTYISPWLIVELTFLKTKYATLKQA